MNIYTIYRATNLVNNKCYIGFDSNWPTRKFNHIAGHGYKGSFAKAIIKYGPDNFQWEILYQSQDPNHTLKVMESHFIVENNSFLPNGYNMTLGGEGSLGHKKSPEALIKMANASRGKIRSKESIAKGVKTTKARSVEDKSLSNLKRSIANKNQPLELRLRRGAHAKGKPKSLEHRAKISKSNKGKPKSLEHRAKISLVKRRPISTPFGIFQTLNEAAEHINLHKNTIARRVNNLDFPSWFVINANDCFISQ